MHKLDCVGKVTFGCMFYHSKFCMVWLLCSIGCAHIAHFKDIPPCTRCDYF